MTENDRKYDREVVYLNFGHIIEPRKLKVLRELNGYAVCELVNSVNL